MFKDLKLIVDDENCKYTYEIKDGEIRCEYHIENRSSTVDLFYDENIYENIKSVSFQQLSPNKIRFNLDDIENDNLIFNVEINYKYFIKTIYKYLNKLIDKNGLLDELKFFKEIKSGKKYQEKLEELIGEIEEDSLDDLLLSAIDEGERIENILLNNELYVSLADDMKDLDLMLLITNYIYCNVVPKISQETFNSLVNEAINYADALENVWRLGMNYDERGYDFDLLDKYFVDSRNAWYLSEYISSINQVNQEKIVNLLIETRDKLFIEKLLEDNFFQDHLKEKYKQELKDFLNES